MPISVQDFAQQYKAKNPQFQSMDDLSVAQMVARSYPEYQTKIDFAGVKQAPQPISPAQKPNQQPQGKSLFQKVADTSKSVLDKGSDLLFGNFSKTAGTPIVKAIGGATSLYGDVTGSQKAQAVGKKLEATPLQGPGATALAALEVWPGGGILTNSLKKLPGGEAIAKMLVEHVPANLREMAVKQYSEALGATTNELKAKTSKVVPELINKGVAGSLSKIQGLAEGAIDLSGEAIKKAGDNIPAFAKSNVKPIVDKAVKLKNSYIVNGKIVNESAVSAIDSAVKNITQFGHQIPDQSLLKIRRILDKSVAIANKNFTKEEGLSLANEANQSFANAIRGVLNTKYVDLGKANKEFSLWSDVNRIVGKTLERKSTQSGILSKYAIPTLTAGPAFAMGGSPIATGLTFIGTQGFIKLVTSPAYKTVSAVTKNRLADYIASGKIKEATLLTSKILNIINNANSK